MRRLDARVAKLEAQTHAVSIGMPCIVARPGEELSAATERWKKARGLTPDQPLPRRVRVIRIPAKRPAGETAK